MWEGNFLYTHTYGKGNEWSVNYTYSSESEDEQNEYSTMQMENDTKDNEWVWDANYLHIGKVHWQHHLSEWTKLSAGYELEALRANRIIMWRIGMVHLSFLILTAQVILPIIAPFILSSLL